MTHSEVVQHGKAVFEHSMKRYPQHFGVVAGYLPHDARAIEVWQADLRAQALETPVTPYRPAVRALAELIDSDGIVRMYVSEMISQVPLEYRKIASIDELLHTLDYIVQHAPVYNPDPAKRVFFPLSALFVYMMYTPAGEAAFRNAAFNEALRALLLEWCAFLDSPASLDVLNTGKHGWLSPSAYEYNRLEEFVMPDQNAPHWGFASFNAYFHRQIKPERRPVAAPGDAKVIVSANDGTVFQIARQVRKSDTFWLKSQPYSLDDILDRSPLTERFVGGDVLQAFLSGANYHRWHAPIAGVVREVRVVPGLMFSELHALGFDPDAGTLSQGYESAVNTRGIVIIDSEDATLGLVAVVPIGITEISSIRMSVEVGQRVEKGEELGRFNYGGSTLCVLFQAGAVRQFKVHAPVDSAHGSTVYVNGQIAVAN